MTARDGGRFVHAVVFTSLDGQVSLRRDGIGDQPEITCPVDDPSCLVASGIVDTPPG